MSVFGLVPGTERAEGWTWKAGFCVSPGPVLCLDEGQRLPPASPHHRGQGGSGAASIKQGTLEVGVQAQRKPSKTVVLIYCYAHTFTWGECWPLCLPAPASHHTHTRAHTHIHTPVRGGSSPLPGSVEGGRYRVGREEAAALSWSSCNSLI